MNHKLILDLLMDYSVQAHSSTRQTMACLPLSYTLNKHSLLLTFEIDCSKYRNIIHYSMRCKVKQEVSCSITHTKKMIILCCMLALIHLAIARFSYPANTHLWEQMLAFSMWNTRTALDLHSTYIYIVQDHCFIHNNFIWIHKAQ